MLCTMARRRPWRSKLSKQWVLACAPGSTWERRRLVLMPSTCGRRRATTGPTAKSVWRLILASDTHTHVHHDHAHGALTERQRIEAAVYNARVREVMAAMSDA